MKSKTLFLIVFISLSLQMTAQQNTVFIEGFAQGTTYHITYIDKENRNLKQEIDGLLSDFDLSVSTYNPNSIISKINTNKQVIVDDYFKACFKKAKKIWKLTNGAFDPTVFPLVNAWGFGPHKKESLDQSKIDSILEFVGFDKIEIQGNTVVKKDPRIKLDFNAFAQGYSVDVVSAFLESKSINSYLVEIGGEVYAKGKKSEFSMWKIGIEQPEENKESENPIIAIVSLDNRAVATSGNYRKFIELENGFKYAHHINPITGYPTKNNVLSVSVFSKKCIISDAMATAFLVMGLPKTLEYLKKHREIDAFLIYSDEFGNYNVYHTEGLRSLIEK
jgi:thiamine biosynthesis lipoprotein